MSVIVTPGNDRNTHHVKLTDGVTDIGLVLCDRGGSADARSLRRDPIPRSSVKIYAGEQRHSDLLPPWDDRNFNDWSGGMGGEKLEDDTTKYADGMGVDTTRGGQIVLGPMAKYTEGVRTEYAGNWRTFTPVSATWSGVSFAWMNLDGSPRAIAVSFTMTCIGSPPATITPEITLVLKKTGTVPSGACVKLYTDNSGSPGTLVADSTVNFRELDDAPREFVCLIGTTITVADTYWVVIDGGAGADTSNFVSVLCEAAGSATSKSSTDLSTWAASADDPIHRVTTANAAMFGAHFAMLKGALYAALEYYNGTTSKVMINGAAGIATAGAATYLRDTNNASITNDKFNGSVVKLTSGTGAHVPSPHRIVSDTKTTNSEIDVLFAWDSTPDATTEYAVIASEYWTEVTGHGLSAGQYITDALGVNGAIYFARGDGAAIKRLREYWTAGAPGTYWNWADEAINATFLEKIVNPGSTDVWAAKRIPPAKIQRAPGLDCTGTGAVAALTFGTAVNVGDLGEKITGLLVAGESFPLLHVFKEGSIHQVVYDAPNEVRISDLPNAADERNGAAACVHDVYMYFSFLDSIERYYRGQLDDIGPARAGALPFNRRGRIVSMVACPGRLYASIDAGRGGYSSIVVYNGQGWHEVWRAPMKVKSTGIDAQPRIAGDLFIQPVPGDNVDRLWFSWNGDLIWIPVAIDPYHALENQGAATTWQFYPFNYAGTIETPWFHFGLEEVDKLFNKVTVIGDYLGTYSTSEDRFGRVYLDYKIDDDETYTVVGKFTFVDNIGSLDLDPSHNLTGRRIKLRLRIEATQSTWTPRITGVTIEGLVTTPHKYEDVLTFRLRDNDYTLLPDQHDDITSAATKFAKLSEWAGQAGTVRMDTYRSDLYNARVKIDAPSMQILDHVATEIDGRVADTLICQLRLIEVD